MFGINDINKTSKERLKRHQVGGDHLETLDDTTKPAAKPRDNVVKPHDDPSKMSNHGDVLAIAVMSIAVGAIVSRYVL